MMLRFTLSMKDGNDPGDLLIEAEDIVAVLEGRAPTGDLTAMLYTRWGQYFMVDDHNRDTQDRVMAAKDTGMGV